MNKRSLKIFVLTTIVSLSTLIPILHSVEFSNSFKSVLKSKRKLTKQELIRSIRLMIAAEYEAVQLYTQLAESIDDKLAKKVLIDIANEEKVHAGEFLRLLKHLAPDEEKHYKEGAEEVEEEMAKMKSKGKE